MEIRPKIKLQLSPLDKIAEISGKLHYITVVDIDSNRIF